MRRSRWVGRKEALIILQTHATTTHMSVHVAGANSYQTVKSRPGDAAATCNLSLRGMKKKTLGSVQPVGRAPYPN